MRKIKQKFLLSFFLLGMFSMAYTQNFQFQQLKNLYGARINSIDNVGVIMLYAGTTSGIYFSSDKGLSWHKELDGVSVNKIVAVSKELAYAGTTKGLYARMAGKWEKVSGFTNENINDLGVLNSGIIFVSVKNDGLYKASTDNNAFTKVTNLGYASSQYHITCNGNTVFVDLMMSNDAGATWETINSGWPEFRSLNTLGANMADSLIIAGSDNGIFRYDFQKKTWEDLKLYQACLDVNIDDGSPVFMSTAGGVYRSVDRGEKWQQINIGLLSAFVPTICIMGDSVFAGTINGINVTSLTGTLWSTANTGITEVPVYALYPDTNSLLISSGRGVLQTSDDGNVWKTTRRMDVGITFNDKVTKFLKSGNGRWYASTMTGLYFSDNGGQSWLIYRGYVGQQIYDFTFDKYGNLIKGAADGVFKSTDNGMTWTKLNENTSLGTVTCIATDDQNRIYAGTYQGIFASDNKGTKWTNISQDSLKEIQFVRLVHHGNYIYAATSKGVFTYDILYANWSESQTGMGSRWVNDLIRTDKGDFYAATGNGIYYSSDSCAVWQAVDMGDAGKSVQCLAFDPEGNLYYGTNNNGVYTSKTSLTKIDAPETVSANSTLSNFPNPFRQETTITYYLLGKQMKTHVNLLVTNIMGQKVKLLLHTTQNPGKHQLVFRPEGLKPGVYFLLLKTENRSFLRKIIVDR